MKRLKYIRIQQLHGTSSLNGEGEIYVCTETEYIGPVWCLLFSMMIPFAHRFFFFSIQTPYYFWALSSAIRLWELKSRLTHRIFFSKIPKQTYVLSRILLKFFQTGIVINLGLMVRWYYIWKDFGLRCTVANSLWYIRCIFRHLFFSLHISIFMMVFLKP